MERYIIRRETAADERKTEELIREAFWNVYRPGCYEHYLMHVLRESDAMIGNLNLVMEQNGQLIGHAVMVRSFITKDDGEQIEAPTLGPICIHPDAQRQGYGRVLLDTILDEAEKCGYGAVCLTGNAAFYGESGFVTGSSMHIRYGDEPAGAEVPYFLVKELKPGFLQHVSGVYREDPVYMIDEAESEQFDLTFPPKKKERRPGQLV